jgi:hypothetical protein
VAGGRGTASAVHLNNWIDDGSKEDQGFAGDGPEDPEDHDFAVKSRRTPIDPVPHWPPGQMLAEVKLHRARGGCLGAKSR